jgi:hypothetical protein
LENRGEKGECIYGPSRMGELVEGETFVVGRNEIERKSGVGFMRWQTATDEKRTNASVFLAAPPWEIVGIPARTCLLGATGRSSEREPDDDDSKYLGFAHPVIVVILLPLPHACL